ncbi:hypothetical protein IQ235_10580 [Oscillatoriales cyanobacterium LEGE 11467]|uniref:Glycine-rich domain-containing protein-like n=1 Tax=Zarconia navalis LEGE 11467 TaxID=1828826 RepID=A0A928VVR1_9CYAN|nr:hypothetical protein [Zarconia navalis]MBE9041224.1 hypothetical protein [Zarconia navalis LEGE 11467]
MNFQHFQSPNSNPSNSLEADALAFVGKLASLDLGPIAYKLMSPEDGPGWTQAEATMALVQYMRFLLLVFLYPNSTLIPTPEIDRVWHCHILDTSKYAEDTQMLFGRFLHHFPYMGTRSEVDRQQLYSSFEQTRKLFEQHFEIPISQMRWSQVSACKLFSGSEQHRPSIPLSLDPFQALWGQFA